MKNIPTILSYSAGVILLIAGLPFVVGSLFPSFECGSYYGKGLSSQQATGKSETEIARQLTEIWLDSDKNRWSCPAYRLSDYTIGDIRVIESLRDSTFQYTVSYDVKKPLFLAGSGWNAGNGVEEGRWVRRKFSFVTVNQDSAGYHIEKTGSGF